MMIELNKQEFIEMDISEAEKLFQRKEPIQHEGKKYRFIGYEPGVDIWGVPKIKINLRQIIEDDPLNWYGQRP